MGRSQVSSLAPVSLEGVEESEESEDHGKNKNIGCRSMIWVQKVLSKLLRVHFEQEKHVIQWYTHILY